MTQHKALSGYCGKLGGRGVDGPGFIVLYCVYWCFGRLEWDGDGRSRWIGFSTCVALHQAWPRGVDEGEEGSWSVAGIAGIHGVCLVCAG